MLNDDDDDDDDDDDEWFLLTGIFKITSGVVHIFRSEYSDRNSPFYLSHNAQNKTNLNAKSAPG